MAYHWLRKKGTLERYTDYLKGAISRTEFYNSVPDRVTESVINAEIEEKTLPDIFRQVDLLLGDRRLDLIIGGPPCQAYSLVGRSRSPQE